MSVTVTMIEEKEFKTKMRGYDPIEVDEFLDDICDEMVGMQEEIIALQSRLAKSGAPVFNQPVQAPISVPQVVPTSIPVPKKAVEEERISKKESTKEDATQDVVGILKSAQKVYDQTIQDAKKEADHILARAKEVTGQDLDVLKEQRDALKEEIAQLKDTAKSYHHALMSMMEEHKASIHHAEEWFNNKK